jgi:tetratricopeptide (TPR) repeat protein
MARRTRTQAGISALCVLLGGVVAAGAGATGVPASVRVGHALQEPPAATRAQASMLEIGVLVERAMKADEEHVHRIRLRTGEYMKAVVEQKGIDVAVSLIEPNGDESFWFSSPNGTHGFEPVDMVAKVTGEYGLKVWALDGDELSGTYVVRVEAVRAATSRDRVLAEARHQAALVWHHFYFGHPKPPRDAARAAWLFEKALGPDAPDVAAALDVLALHHEGNEEFVTAERLYRRSLAIYEKAFGPEHPDVAVVLSDLAGLYWNQRDYVKAETYFRRALSIKEKALGRHHRDVVSTLASLIEICDEQGEPAKTEPLYEHVLAIWEQALGPEHPSSEKALNDLIAVYRKNGSDAKLEPLWQRILADRVKSLGPEHPKTVDSLLNLAMFYERQHQYAKSDPLFMRHLEIRERALGSGHAVVGHTMVGLAEIFAARGEYSKAEPLYERALVILDKELEDYVLATTLIGVARF